MRYEWDQAKAESNYRKHWVQFADAILVFDDYHALTHLDPTAGEERYVTIGMDEYGRVLVVVYTWRGDAARIISARKATRAEERKYVERKP